MSEEGPGRINDPTQQTNGPTNLLEELGGLEALEEKFLVESLGWAVVDLVQHPALEQLLVAHSHLKNRGDDVVTI